MGAMSTGLNRQVGGLACAAEGDGGGAASIATFPRECS